MSTIFKKVLIVGAGTLGVQIARRFLKNGMEVVLCDLSESALSSAKKELNSKNASFLKKIDNKIGDCDLVIESITEVLKIKQKLFAQIEKHVKDETVLTTNSSMLLPSKIAKKIKNKKRFCAFHFYWPDDDANIADIMPIKNTDKAVVEKLKQLAVQTGFDPVVICKENQGYVYNAIFSAINGKSLTLVIRGVTTIEDVDKSFRNVTKAPRGPFQMMDMVGLDTVMHITKNMAKKNPINWVGVKFLKKYVDKGKLGVKTKEGFYKYED